MAASFDDKLLYQIYDAISDEARAKYNHWLDMGNENKRFLSLSACIQVAGSGSRCPPGDYEVFYGNSSRSEDLESLIVTIE